MDGQSPCAGSSGQLQAERPGLELADIVRQFRQAYQATHPLMPTERAVLDAVERCRTAALGGHVDVCLHCGFQRPSFNSCRDRHCPKCPAVAQAKWISGRLRRVLPTHYFHVVFTLPAALRAVAIAHRSVVYDLLFHCATETLLQLGRDPERLGGELGITAVLHSWSRELAYHPHLHCIVTGGALSSDGGRWLAARENYLFPVKVMAQLFRGKMLNALRRAEQRGQLRLRDPARFAALLSSLYRTDWVVYCKRPFGGPEQVIRYLGQYTHRVALSNQRLLAIDEHGVTFRTKSGKRVTLRGQDFLARWLTHILPPGFVKIRHYGLVSSAHATTRLELARELLQTAVPQLLAAPLSPVPLLAQPATTKWRDIIELLTGFELDRCPACGGRCLQRQPLPPQSRSPPRTA